MEKGLTSLAEDKHIPAKEGAPVTHRKAKANYVEKEDTGHVSITLTNTL